MVSHSFVLSYQFEGFLFSLYNFSTFLLIKKKKHIYKFSTFWCCQGLSPKRNENKNEGKGKTNFLLNKWQSKRSIFSYIFHPRLSECTVSILNYNFCYTLYSDINSTLILDKKPNHMRITWLIWIFWLYAT